MSDHRMVIVQIQACRGCLGEFAICHISHWSMVGLVWSLWPPTCPLLASCQFITQRDILAVSMYAKSLCTHARMCLPKLYAIAPPALGMVPQNVSRRSPTGCITTSRGEGIGVWYLYTRREECALFKPSPLGMRQREMTDRRTCAVLQIDIVPLEYSMSHSTLHGTHSIDSDL
jgi:hypothetical protein